MIATKPHPRFKELCAVLLSLGEGPSKSWRRPVYRSVELKWAKPAHLLNGQGTQRYGSRWMRPGQARAIHAASSEALALKESRRQLEHYAILRPRKNPRVVVEIQAYLPQVIDVADLPDRLPWLSLEELLNDDWQAINQAGHETLSQSLGRAAWQGGWPGLIVPSARDARGRNLIWFPDHVHAPGRLEISHQEELDQGLT